MSAFSPVPRTNDPREWERFLGDIKRYFDSVFVSLGVLAWDAVSKTGSNLTDLGTFNHNELQNLNLGDYLHLSAAQKTGLTTGAATTLHTHDHTGLNSVGVNTHVQIDSHISAATNAHGVGVSASLVGTDTSQNLTNKLYALRDGGTLVIASGVVTVTASLHTLDTEGAAVSDDLDTINGGVTNQILVLGELASARDVTIKNGTGNIQIGSDYVMSNTYSRIVLVYNGANWVQLSRSN